MIPLPLLSKIFGGVAAVAIIAAGVQTVRLSHTQTELAEEKLAYVNFRKDLAEKSAKAQQETAEKAAAAISSMDDTLRGISNLSTQVRTEIRYVQSNGGPCPADPAYLAGIDGVQRLFDARKIRAGGGAPQDQPRPAGAVRGAGTAVPR